MWARLSTIIILTFIMGCTSEDSANVATGGRISPTYAGPAELSYCSTPTTYSMPKITVSGTAQYTRRNTWGIYGAGAGGLGGASTSSGHAATVHNIRHAEVRVTDAGGNVVQCTDTGAAGTFSFELPQGDTTYTVSIYSRGSNSFINASVLNRPEQNLPYHMDTTVTATANVSGVTFMAPANGTTALGAAFNILDQIHNANDYLRAQVSNCSGSYAGCTNFTVAPKVSAYWELGYNPNGYFGSSSGLSFYLPGYSRLFILGGQDGDVDNSDTDHFDNSVILHEYGHFLEDSMFISDSPGGSHNGDKIIDPRLAWSEGWGNFFQAAVRNTAKYTDSLGNDDGVTRLIYDANLETFQIGNDEVGAPGEGNFREFSVTRLLWDAIDAAGDTFHAVTDDVATDFPRIWAALTKSSNGFRDTDWAFRNIGHVHYGQTFLAGSNWSNIRTIEWQDGNTNEYARYMSTSGTCPFTKTMTPVSDSSDLFRNYDFYHVKVTSTGTITFSLDYQDANGVGPVADLDLYLYNESARLGASEDVLKYSRATPDSNAATVKTESFSVSLSPGNYLLVVTAYVGTTTGSSATYSIKRNGAQLCPDTL